MNRRQKATFLYLLRAEAIRQRQRNGTITPGGVLLSPDEMEAWADEIEQCIPVSGACVNHEFIHDSASGRHFCGHCYRLKSEIEAEERAVV